MKMTILDHLRLDHAYLHTLLDRACDPDTDDRAKALAALLDALVRHETAEAALVRPRTREIPGGHAVAAQLDEQERAISQLVATLETIDPAADQDHYDQVLSQLRCQALQHMAAEEHAEHPRLQGACAEHMLVDLGRRYVRVADVDLEAAGEGHGDVAGDSSPRSFARAREVVRASLLT